jgi:hypothetical protein
MRIEDGTGSGKKVKVNSLNQLSVSAVSSSRQHEASHEDQKAYQISANLLITNSKQNLLLITNNSTDDLIVTYIRVMSIGAAAANVGAFFTLEVGGSYSSGGTAVTPTNVSVGSSNSADATVYDGQSAITVADFTEIDRNYTANSMQSYSKDGSIVLPRGASFLVTHTGSTVAGTAYCRVSFYFASKE